MKRYKESFRPSETDNTNSANQQIHRTPRSRWGFIRASRALLSVNSAFAVNECASQACGHGSAVRGAVGISNCPAVVREMTNRSRPYRLSAG